MKPYYYVAALCSCMLLTACRQQTNAKKAIQFRPLQNGFGVVLQPVGIDSGPGAKLYYKGTNETPVLVWPHIGTRGYPILFTNDVALLLGDRPDTEGRLVNSALVAVQGEGLAMDISDDILKISAAQNQVDLQKALRACTPLELHADAGQIKVLFLGRKYLEPTIPDLEAKITWEQVFAIMKDVKRTGKTNKVTNTDVLYLQKDYGVSIRQQ